METCYKLFRTEIIQSIKLKENRFGFEPEVTAKISKLKKYSDLRDRYFLLWSDLSGRQENKLEGWSQGNILHYQIWIILKMRYLTHPAHFFSG